jgi:hypothetical protein
MSDSVDTSLRRVNKGFEYSLSGEKFSFDNTISWGYTLDVMKRVFCAAPVVLVIFIFSFFSCGSGPETVEPPPVVQTEVVEKPVEPPPEEVQPAEEAPPEPTPEETPPAEEAPVEELEQEPPPAEEPPVEEPEQEEPTEDEPEPEDPPVEEPPEEEPEEPVDDPPEEQPSDEFKVTEEIFTETFENIRTIITQLNGIIRDENYTRWLGYLAREYIAHFSSAEILKQNSDQPILRKYGVVLRSLEDYFTYVVVPSRSNARLDDLVFIDNDHLKAIMIISDRRTILYQLTKVDGVWKIGL